MPEHVTSTPNRSPSPYGRVAENHDATLPLMEQVASTNFSTAALSHSPKPWLPQRAFAWLTNRYWSGKTMQTTDHERGIPLSEAIEEQDLEKEPSASLRRNVVVLSALSLIGAAAVGSLAFNRHAARGKEITLGNNNPSLNNSAEILFGLPGEVNPDDGEYPQASAVKAEKKECWFEGNWPGGGGGRWGPCPEDRPSPVYKEKASEEKDKRCWYPGKWPAGGGGRWGDCPEDRPKPVFKNKTTPKAKTTTTTTTTPAPTGKKTWYQKRHEPAKCYEPEVHFRCENVHANFAKADKLILQYGNIDCYCPPPQAKRSRFEIVYIDDNTANSNSTSQTDSSTATSTTPRAKITYYQKQDEPAVCHEKAVQARCENMHSQHAKVNRLMLPVYNETCYCPPPQAHQSDYEVTFLDDKNNEPPRPSTTPKPVISTARTTTPASRPGKKKYFQMKNQAPICKEFKSLQRCENVHKAFRKADRLPLQFGVVTCYCPPPEAKKHKYEIIYLDEEITQTNTTSTEPTANVTRLSDIKPQAGKRGEKIFYLHLPEEEFDKLGRPSLVPLPEPKDDVSIKVMYDLACLEARNNMGWSNIARVVGETLEEPVTKLSEEIAVIHSHRTGQGCPPPEDLAKLREITSRVDKVLSNTLQILPHAQPIRIVQNLIGPGLQIFADDLDGIESDKTKLTNLAQQFTMTMKDMLPTLTTSQKISLYSKDEQDGSVVPDKKIFTDRFNFHDGKSYVVIGGKEYQIRSKADDIPYVIDDNEKLSFIQYNQDVGQWGFIEEKNNLFYADNNQDNAQIFSKALDDLPAGFKAEIDYTTEFVTLKSPGKADITGVFCGNEFIPATLEKIAFRQVAFTNTPGQTEMKSLKQTPAGWVFDSPTTEMDEYLKLLLESTPKGISLSAENKIGPIDDIYKFSNGERGGSYIKNKDKYYRINLHSVGSSGEYYYEPEDFPQAKVNLKNDIFILESDPHMLFPLKTTVLAELFPVGNTFYIESNALNFLLNYGETTQVAALEKELAGVYSDKKGNFLFAAQGSKFTVKTYTQKTVSIKGNAEMGRTTDIVLWSDGDTYYRVRDELEKPPAEYSEIGTCRAKRSPGAADNCVPVMIEQELHLKLKKHMLKGTTANSVPLAYKMNEISAFDISFLYQDVQTKKYYFLYEDAYFDAEVLESSDTNNPTGLHGLKLSGKGNFFNRGQFIANIVCEKKDDHIEIKTMDTYLAENLKVSKDIATNYIKKRPWRDLRAMNAVEESVGKAKVSGDVFVDVSIDTFASPQARQNFAAQWDEARAQLYPQRLLADGNYFFRVFLAGSNAEDFGAYEQNALPPFRKQMEYIQEKVIPTVVSSLYYDTPGGTECEDYVSEILLSNDRRFSNNFMVSLRQRLQKMDSALTHLDKNNQIYLATALRHDGTFPKEERLSSLLTPEERSSGSAAIMPNNGDGNLFINIDKMNDIDLMSVILQGAAQTEGMSKEISGIEREQGIYISINDAIRSLANKLQQHELSEAQFSNLKKISTDYLNNVPAYNSGDVNNLLEQRKLAFLLLNDPGYKAHVLLHSSEYLTLLTQDLYHRLSVKNAEGMPSRIDSWMKKYGEQRAFNIIKEKQPLRTDLTNEKVTETIVNTDAFTGEEYLKDIQGMSEISDALQYPARNSDLVSQPIAEYMRQKGFTHIRHRAMAMFIAPGDGTPATHFAVVGELQGKDYVFDLLAGEFAERYDDLNGPLLLPERKWAQKYTQASDKLLVKYADFSSLDDARQLFNQHNKLLYWGPEIKIPNARVLRRPDWYFPEPVQPDVPALPGLQHASRLGYTNPVREAARRSQLSTQIDSFSWNYAVKLLENAELLTQGAAAELRAAIMQANEFMRGKAKTPGALDDLLIAPHPVTTKEELLRVKSGELLAFMATVPDMVEKGPHPEHVMVSTGNGRFAGIKSSLLDPHLDDEKKILTAEQLGELVDGKLKNTGKTAAPNLQLLAGYPGELLISKYPTLRELAERTAMRRNNGIYIATETAEILRVSGELAAEQSLALEEALTPLLKASGKSGVSGRAIQNLLFHPDRLNNKSDLATLPKGQLVIFGKLDSSYAAKHIMYSLGYGEFVMIDPTHLDTRLTCPNSIVEAWQFPDEIFKQYKILAGGVALDELRITSLLGPEAKFVVKNNVVKVTAHGSASNTAFLDASELADVIRGLGIRENPPVDWDKIEQVELNSCYSALGRLPMGKVVANLLNKPVKAWPRLYNERVRDNPDIASKGKTYEPEQMTTEQRELMRKQATRNHYFWSHLLYSSLYRTFDHLRKKRDTHSVNEMLTNVFAVANGNVTVDTFFTALPKYKEQLNTSPELFAEVVGDPIYNAQEFAERCMDIFYLSDYSYRLLNEHLSQLD